MLIKGELKFTLTVSLSGMLKVFVYAAKASSYKYNWNWWIRLKVGSQMAKKIEINASL